MRDQWVEVAEVKDLYSFLKNVSRTIKYESCTYIG